MPAGVMPASSGSVPLTCSCSRRDVRRAPRSASAPGAEEDLLERLAGVGEPLERCQLRVRVLAGADVVERHQRADAQRALAVEQARRGAPRGRGAASSARGESSRRRVTGSAPGHFRVRARLACCAHAWRHRALSRPAAVRARGPGRLARRGLDPAGPGPAAVRARRRRGVAEARGREPDRLVQGPRDDLRGVRGGRGRAPQAVVCASTGNTAASAAAYAARPGCAAR